MSGRNLCTARCVARAANGRDVQKVHVITTKPACMLQHRTVCVVKRAKLAADAKAHQRLSSHLVMPGDVRQPGNSLIGRSDLSDPRNPLAGVGWWSQERLTTEVLFVHDH